ncbi:MAG: EAL domain-containing protein [Lachnospiraceae bacterium]|nr:EAL domain-containing protein [Lachnospiraceae bacterium]
MAVSSKPVGDALRTYIIENIDRATEENWIKVFYQPVVRTYTGEICGMEALARWIDPDFGMLSPLEFITILEEEKLIHKLDSFIIRKICEDYTRIRADYPGEKGTVSFNLSRLDFTLCDIHKIIEDSIKKNRIPREALRIEITESTMVDDSDLMHNAIDRFWDKGLRVWMDDFGSGYSSLNVLKDYHFDTLKIDMVFMRSFDPKSKEIVRSVVDMAKRLGIHTLAEGIETAEQLEFLKSIGCEKAQGYYIGRPMSIDECISYIIDSGLVVESANKRQYYHDIGRVNVLSATPFNISADGESRALTFEEQAPLAIIEYTKDKIRYLFANETYLKTLRAIGAGDLRSLELEFEAGVTELKSNLSRLFNQARTTGEVVSAEFMSQNHFCHTKVRSIAGYPGGNAFLAILQDMSDDEAAVKNAKLLDALKCICNIYDSIVSVDLNTGYSESIFRPAQTRTAYHKNPAMAELRQYAKEEVYAEDRESFIEFHDLSTAEERISRSSVGHISAPFRTRMPDGSYRWTLYSLMGTGKSGERKILSCMRPLPVDAVARLHKEYNIDTNPENIDELNALISQDVLWRNFINNGDTPFFWKDRERRYLGVNRKFLDYFGFDGPDILLGRTDENMGWRLDYSLSTADEEKVLKHGESVYLRDESYICKGQIRNVNASKMPIYLNGDVVGIMGYFIDVEDQAYHIESELLSNSSDPETGSLNFLGLAESVLLYQEKYLSENKDFVIILFAVSNINDYRKNFGTEWTRQLLKEVGNCIKKFTGHRGVTGRINDEQFAVVIRSDTPEDAAEFVSGACEAVEEIKTVDGTVCTPYLAVGIGRYSEHMSLQNMFTAAQEKLLKA